MKTDCEFAEIIDDDDESGEETTNDQTKATEVKEVKEVKPKEKKVKQVKAKQLLKQCLNDDPSIVEIGVDEAGRGPLFGRVYAAAVILPKDNTFDCTKVKDSKKFHSKKKIDEAAEYIKQHALAWHVSFVDEQQIDEINILQATQSAMHDSIMNCQKMHDDTYKKNKENKDNKYSYHLLIDGNYFKPIVHFNKHTNKIEGPPYTTVEGGDNHYASIAAASILAKVYRDKYIETLCEQYPELVEKYDISSNKGYGTKKHIEGIKSHGITIWHRRSFAPCKHY